MSTITYRGETHHARLLRPAIWFVAFMWLVLAYALVERYTVTHAPVQCNIHVQQVRQTANSSGMYPETVNQVVYYTTCQAVGVKAVFNSTQYSSVSTSISPWPQAVQEGQDIKFTTTHRELKNWVLTTIATALVGIFVGCVLLFLIWCTEE